MSVGFGTFPTESWVYSLRAEILQPISHVTKQTDSNGNHSPSHLPLALGTTSLLSASIVHILDIYMKEIIQYVVVCDGLHSLNINFQDLFML